MDSNGLQFTLRFAFLRRRVGQFPIFDANASGQVQTLFVRLTKTADQIDFLYGYFLQTFSLLTAHADTQFLHGLNHMRRNHARLDAGAEDAGARWRQVPSASLCDLAQAGVVFTKKEYVSFDICSAHGDLRLNLISSHS